MKNYANLETPLPVFLDEKWLYDLDETKTGIKDALIIGVMAYPDQLPRLNLLVGDAIFSFIPVQALFHLDIRDCCATRESFPDESLVYHSCPDGIITIQYWEALYSRTILAFLKNDKAEYKSIQATYCLTIDHPDNNICQHLLQLYNGQFAFVPNHKMLVTDDPDAKLPDYKKLHF